MTRSFVIPQFTIHVYQAATVDSQSQAAKKISTLAIHIELNSCFRELVYPKKKVSKYSTEKITHLFLQWLQ